MQPNTPDGFEGTMAYDLLFHARQPNTPRTFADRIRKEYEANILLANLGERPKIEYLNAASGYLHYIHGVNPLNKVYLSNMGGYGAENSVNEFYHAWFKDGSKYDAVGQSKIGPAPGFLVGGPNDSYSRDECCKTVCGGFGAKMCEIPEKSPPMGQPPEKSYADFNEGKIPTVIKSPICDCYQNFPDNSYKVFFIYILG